MKNPPIPGILTFFKKTVMHRDAGFPFGSVNKKDLENAVVMKLEAEIPAFTSSNTIKTLSLYLICKDRSYPAIKTEANPEF